MTWPVNKVLEAEIKSCKRVPTASTTSALAAKSLALSTPVTPTAPAFNGSLASIEDLPAWVSITGI